ncbi:MAG TPA: protein kinase [Gemmataceae bacterium]|nr:protein kinase [Gemmataceae bacterium]
MTADPARAQVVFLAAAGLDDPAARSAYLDSECAGDPALRVRVEALLRAHDQPDSLLDEPLVLPWGGETWTAAMDGGEDPAAETRTHAPEGHDDPGDALAFLAPPGRPDSLGRIGHYDVLEVLGRGGSGIVYRAFDDVLQRVVAVKVLAPAMAATSPARKRFLREARSSAQVRHENVVQVHEVGEQPLPYLVMEFVPGETLQQRLDRTGPLEVPEVLRIGRQVAAGLVAAHGQGLIHRDIKPSNILLDGGPQPQAKITDFGLARAADDASLTRSGVVAGTPMYMAPEQARGEILDHRADLFSLGSVLYAMLTGRPPFRASNTPAVLKRVAEDTPRPIREVIPEVPDWLCRVVGKLHAKDPAGRFQTAAEVADLLADCEQQVKAHGVLKDFARIPGGRPHRSGRKWAAALVVVALVAVVGWAGPSVVAWMKGLGGSRAEGKKPPVVLVLRLSDTAIQYRIDGHGANQTGVSVMELPLEPGDHTVWFALGDRQYQTVPFVLREGEPAELEVDVTADGAAAKWNGQPLPVTRVGGRVEELPASALTEPPSDNVFPGDVVYSNTFDDPKNPNVFVGGPANGEWKSVVGVGKWVTEVTAGYTIIIPIPLEARSAAMATRCRLDGLAHAFVAFRPTPVPGSIAWNVHLYSDGAWKLEVARPPAQQGAHDVMELIAASTEPAPELIAGKLFDLTAVCAGGEVELRVNGRVLVRAADPSPPTQGRYTAVPGFHFCPVATKTKPGRLEVEYLKVWRLPLAFRLDGGNAKAPPPVPTKAADVLPYLAGTWKVETQNRDPKSPPGEGSDVGSLTFDFVAGGKFLRGRNSAAVGRTSFIDLWSFESGNNALRRWVAWSNGWITPGPITGLFNPDNRTLTMHIRIGSADSVHEYAFIDFNTCNHRFFTRDASGAPTGEVRQKWTRVARPVSQSNPPLDSERPNQMMVLDRLVGEWRSDLTVTDIAAPDKPKAHVQRTRVESVLGGRVVEVIDTDEATGGSDYALAWFDADANRYRKWSFGGRGDVNDFAGTWDEAANTLTWTSTDGRLTGRWTFKGDDLREFRHAVLGPDGKPVSEAVGMSRRQAAGRD